MTDHLNTLMNPEKVVTASAPLKSGAATNGHDAGDPHSATLVLHNVKLAIPPAGAQSSYIFHSQFIVEDDQVRHEIYVPDDAGITWTREAGFNPKGTQVWLKTIAPSTEAGCFATSDVCHGPQKNYYIGLIGNLASGLRFEDVKVLPNGDCNINLELRSSISPNQEHYHYFRENPNDSTLFEIALTKGVIEPHGKSANQLCSYINPAHQNHQYLPYIDKASCVSKYVNPGDIIDIKPGLISYYTPKAHFDETCTGLYCNYDLYGEYLVEGLKDIG